MQSPLASLPYPHLRSALYFPIFLIVSGWISSGASAETTTQTPASKTITFVENAEWKAVDMSEVRIIPGSALDLSAGIEPGPAGKHGRVIAGPTGNLVFSNQPGVPIRFSGFDMVTTHVMHSLKGETDEATKANIREFVTLVKRQGYNVIRALCLDTYLMSGSEEDGVVNPVLLDRIDYLFATMKQEGVYIYADVVGYGQYYKGSWEEKVTRWNMKAEVLMGHPDTRANWKAGVTMLLNHVNPYTNVCLRDEPALVCINLYNEQELGLNSLGKKAAALVTEKWHEWLKKRFATPRDLAVAWEDMDLLKIKSMDEVPLPKNPYGCDAPGNEYGHFLFTAMMETHAWYRSVLQEIGYKGLYSWNDASLTYRDGYVRSQSPAISMHNYYCHPQGGSSFTVGAKVAQESSIAKQASYYRSLSWSRVWDKPFLITEHGHCFWNEYEREAGLLFGAYTALQNYESVMVHENPVWLQVTTPMGPFTIGKSPIGRANEFIAAKLYTRGDVTPSTHRVEVRVDLDYLRRNYNRPCDGRQTRLSLLTGFGTRYVHEGATTPSREPDLVIHPESTTTTSGNDWSVNANEASSNGVFSLAAAVESLRKKGILTADNVTNVDEGIFQSDTGQIKLETKEKRLTVITPRTEGMTLNAGQGGKLPALEVVSTEVPAAVTLTSVDGKPLRESRRMVLIYVTESANSGMVLSEDRVTMIKQGTFPPLLRTGQFKVLLSSSNSKGLKVWALGLNGSRREEVATQVNGNALEIALDTAQLKHGPTVFFEVAAE